jgi:hypothetical protein
MALDVEFQSRYAVTQQWDGYEPVNNDHELYPLWLDFVRGFQLAVDDMSCDIQSGLESIAVALQALAARPAGNGCVAGSPGGTVANCLSSLPNSDILGPDESTLTEQPPEGFATWSEYLSHKCKAAYFIVDFLSGSTYSMQGLAGAALTADVVAPLVAGLSGALPAVFTPVGAAAFIAAMVGIGVISLATLVIVMPQIRAYIMDHRDELACSLYQSGSSSSAIDAIANTIEDAIQSISWGAILGPFAGELAPLLGDLFGALLGNGLVQPLFSTVVDLAAFEANCDGCESLGDCGISHRLFYDAGSGDLSGTGERTITLTAASGHYIADVRFPVYTCIKTVSQSGLTKFESEPIWWMWRCVDGEYASQHTSDGIDTNWWCSDRLLVQSATPATFVLDIQSEDCAEDNECP